jgi:hypothetical protein
MNRLRRFLAVLVAILREIFDESAYKRFLVRNELARSSASYAAFLREHQATCERRARCC